jgi:2',3'-cyclic-nucleotide 2'-phosphodiesterase (5'-nucleotidase family)
MFWFIALCTLLISTVSQANNLSFPVTADTQDELQACQDCTLQTQLDELARRSTAVKRLCEENPAVLLVDTGSAFFGADSFPSQRQIIMAAYNELGYDAVNLSYRDFSLGKSATLALLKKT